MSAGVFETMKDAHHKRLGPRLENRKNYRNEPRAYSNIGVRPQLKREAEKEIEVTIVPFPAELIRQGERLMKRLREAERNQP